MIKNESLSCREVISDHKKGDVMNREIKYKHKILKGGGGDKIKAVLLLSNIML